MPRLTISALQRPSDSSPSKRRKTRGNTLKSKKTMHESSWPMGDKKLPVEVYINIIKYLSRKSVEDMRLVCKEMEEKVSGALFDQVVVPFKPEIYGITPEPSLSSTQHEALMAEMGHGSVMLQDKGMRVFQGFGAHIKKFALSFEFEEDKLARPPIKSDQEAITSFWGIYRWPFKAYNRYSQLEGLEQTADETRTMSQALRHMTNSTELGLSVDGGLGWLAGPDINSRVADRDEKNPVFGASKKMLPDLTTKSERMRRANAMDNLGGVSSDGASTQEWTSVERMLREAGYEEGEELDRSVEILLDHDRSALALPRHHNHDSPPASQSSTISVLSRGRPRLRPDTRFEALQLVTRNTHGTVHNPNGMVSYSEDEEEEGSTMPTECAVKVVAGKADASTLKPNDLNNAQREMLLEMEWAQRAFMQSYAIAIMDSHPTFENVTTFTIARLPSRHLPIIHRSDFWDSLPQLKKLSIAIIPDWREVVKLPTSWVQDNKVAPSQSVPGVYHFLKDQIAERKNIKSLHFEWLCGGEEAPGIFSRNQNIVAAPLVPKANDMVNRRHQPPASVLDLSYVQHLSLKNCWVSPHVLEEFGSALKKGELQTLKLESVSLSAPVATNGQPNPLNGHPANNQAAQNAQAQAVAQIGVANGFPALAHLNAPNAHHAFHIHQAQPQPQPQPHPPQQPVPQVVSDWLDQPRNGSWAQIIETLTPGVTLADIRYSRDLAPEPPSRERTHLRRVEFKSCGYVRLPLDFVQTMLDPPDVPAALPTAITKRMGDLEGVMMKHGDYYLGIIINHIHPTEAQVLENAWNMNIGWGRERAELAADSAVDGIRAAGHGRFTGVIEPNPRSTSRTPPFSLS